MRLLCGYKAQVYTYPNRDTSTYRLYTKPTLIRALTFAAIFRSQFTFLLRFICQSYFILIFLFKNNVLREAFDLVHELHPQFIQQCHKCILYVNIHNGLVTSWRKVIVRRKYKKM